MNSRKGRSREDRHNKHARGKAPARDDTDFHRGFHRECALTVKRTVKPTVKPTVKLTFPR